ncbi:tetratricopeptide repeat protein [Limibacter armeniacum]|uniref:tetratricopeptide repeat protein n=1 Tax=Limibacter armeniacum TaxID=466084 RepID=UPI002FE57506
MNPRQTSYFQRITVTLCLLLIFTATGQLAAQSKLDSLKNLYQKATNDSLRIELAISISRQQHYSKHQPDTEYNIANDAINLALELNDTLLHAKALDNLGLLYRYHQMYKKAIDLHAKAYQLVENKPVPPLQKMIFANNTGVASRYANEYNKAVKYHLIALKVAEQENDLKNIAISCNGIGNTLLNIPDRIDEALPYYQRALKAEQKRNNSLGVAMNYLTIGDYYSQKKDYWKAQEYFQKLLVINQQRKDTFGLAITYEYFGRNYYNEGKQLNLASENYLKSYKLFTQLKNKHKQADLLRAMGDVNLTLKRYKEADQYYLKALSIFKTLKDKEALAVTYLGLSKSNEARKQYKSAIDFFKRSEAYKDSVDLLDQKAEIERLQNLYHLEKKNAQIQLLEKDKTLQEIQLTAQKAKLENQQIFVILLGIGLFTVIAVALMQYRNIHIKKTTNELLKKQNKEILKQRDEITEQKAEIESANVQLEKAFEQILNQNRHINDSIQYAKRIQSAMLPTHEHLKSLLPQHFIFFRPRDIVSGDFYWAEKIKDVLLVAAIDCTGHGVPAALMSMMAKAYLDQLTQGEQKTDPATLLKNLNDHISKALQQRHSHNMDGMDMAICKIDPINKTLTFAGAKNPILCIDSDGSLFLKGSPYHIGGNFERNIHFHNQTIPLKKGMRCYLFSDGFQDQFGGPKLKKFTKRQLIDILFQMNDMDFELQQRTLGQVFDTWKGEEEQTDDVLVIGFEV